jgi:hypothetical protein
MHSLLGTHREVAQSQLSFWARALKVNDSGGRAESKQRKVFVCERRFCLYLRQDRATKAKVSME